MPYEFLAKNGLISQGNITATGSAFITQAVGIGTTNPGGKLEIRTDAASNYIFSGSSSSGYTTTFTMDNTALYVGHDSAVRSLTLRTNSTSRLTITGGGNVGIGTTSPLTNLHITNVSANPLAAAIGGDSKLVISGVDGTIDLLSQDDNSTVSNVIGMGRYNSSTGALIHKFGIVTWANTGAAGSNTGDRFGFHYGTNADSYASTELLTIKSGGNVGVGSTNPSYKLDVVGPSTALASQPGIVGRFTQDVDGRTLIRVVNSSISSGAAALQSGISFVTYSTSSNQPSTNTHEAQIILGSTGATSVGQTGTLQIVAPLDIAFNVSASNTIMTGSSYTTFGSNAMYLARSGNVGIGTTSPNAKLDLYNGSDLGSGANGIRVQRPGAYGQYGYLEYLVSSDSTILGSVYTGGGASSFGRIFFRQHSSTTSRDAMVINTDGNVGIGTTSPAAKLDVSGSSNATILNLYRNVNSATTPLLYGIEAGGSPGKTNIALFERLNNLTPANVSASSAGIRIREHSANYALSIEDHSNNSYLVIKGGGNVGIGTTNPAFLLDVSGSSRFGFTSTNTHQFTGSVSLNGSLLTNANITASNISASGTGSFGAVGIGITNPSTKLHVVGSSIIANNTSIDPDSYANTIIAGAISDRAGWGLSSAIGGNAGTGHSWAIGSNGANFYMGYGNASTVDSLQTFLQVSGSRNIGLVPDGGSVGIGTSSPFTKLNVVKAGINEGAISFEDESCNAHLLLQGSDARVRLQLGTYNNGSFGGWIQASYDNSPNSSSNSGTEPLILNPQGGSVGIGTVNPGNKLEVASSAFNRATFKSIGNFQTGIQILRSGSFDTDWELYAPPSSTDLRLYNSSDLVTFKSTGNVGIGTTTPNSKLEVAGTAGTAIISVNNTTAGRSGSFGIDSAGVYIRNSNDGDYFDLENASGTSRFRLVYDNNTFLNTTYTSVGSLTSSGSKLSVFGNLSVGSSYGSTAAPSNGAIFQGGVGIGTTNPYYAFDVYTNSTAGALMSIRASGSANARIYFDAANGDLTGGDYCYIGQESGSLNFVINTDVNSGNIHIQPRFGSATDGRLIVSGSSQFGRSVASNHQFTGSVIGNFTSSRSVGVGFLGTSSWAATATTLSSSNISQFTNDSKYHYHRTDISSLSSSATNIVQPVSTFDYNNATNGPTNAWYNYFSSTHNDYLTSLIANRHRSADWYVAYKEGPVGTPTNPSWYLLLHTGNYNTYAPTLTGTGASGTWSITSSMANALNSANSYTVGSLTSTVQASGATGTLVSYVTPGIYALGSSTGNGIGLISNTSFANQGAIANIGLHQVSASVNDITAGVYMSIGGWHQNSGNGLPVYIGGGYISNSSSILSVVPTNTAGAGNVGIGTRLPGYKLDVNGDIRAMSGSTIRLQTSAGQERGTFQATDTTGAGGAGLAIATSGGEEIAFKDSTDVNMVIKGTGRVGIGTITPAEMLHISSSNNTQLRLESGADAAVQFVGPDTHSYAIGMDDSDDKFKISYNASRTPPGLGTNDRLVIDTSGNVGIGTTSMVAKLDVYDNTDGALLSFVRNASAGSSAYSAFVLRRDGNNNGIVLFTNSSTRTTDGGAGNSTIRTDNGNLLLGAGGSQHILTTAGNVGIGTTVPNNRLHVYNSAGSSTTASNAIAVFEQNSNAGIQVCVPDASEAGLFFSRNGAAYYSAVTRNGTDLLLKNGSSTAVTINSSRYVGIGTSSPSYILHVNGGATEVAGQNTAVFEKQSSTDGRIASFVNTTGSGYSSFIYIGSNPGRDWKIGKNVLNSGTTGHFQITNDLNQMRMQINASDDSIIFPTGSVGIGTTTTTGLLTLHGTYPQLVANNPTTGSGVVIQLKDNGRDAGFMGHATTTSRLQFGSRGLSETHMTINENGNLGIGITNPAAKLSVTGSGTGQMLAGAAGFGSGNYTGISVNGTLNTSAYNILSSPTDTTLYLNRPSGGNINFRENNSDQMVLLTGGNLGIGTSNPSAKVQISGSANSVLLNVKSPISGNIVYVTGSGAVGINTTTPAYTLQVNGSFAATTKSFVIDHPTKPDKKLVYGSLESPYHGIRLTGRDTLVDGKCVVELPDYISKLIMPETVNIQLTGIKCNKTLYVDDINIKENNFTVAYDKGVFESYKDYDFFWDFTAVRADVPELQTEM